MNFMRTFIPVVAVAGLFVTFGCEGTLAENIDEASDCRSVCNRYADCFDSSYDVDSCIDRCTSGSDDGNVADACEACVDDASCSESFGCAVECAGVVP